MAHKAVVGFEPTKKITGLQPAGLSHFPTPSFDNEQRGIRTPGPLRVGSLAKNWFKPTHPSVHQFKYPCSDLNREKRCRRPLVYPISLQGYLMPSEGIGPSSPVLQTGA